MRTFGAIIIAAWVSWFLCDPALAEKRVALVIGNSAYENVARLGNPANDATAMTATLKEAGFDVVDSRLNLNNADMRRAFRDFSDKARDADVGSSILQVTALRSTEPTTLSRLTRHWSVTTTFTMRHF